MYPEFNQIFSFRKILPACHCDGGNELWRCVSRGLVLVAADSAPTAYMENGKPSGILVDVVTEAFKRTGHQFEIQLMPWARCLAETRSGRVDGIFSVFKLPERNEFLTYANVPIITQVLAFFAPADF